MRNAYTADLTIFVQNLLEQMQQRFNQMSSTIINRIDDMGEYDFDRCFCSPICSTYYFIFLSETNVHQKLRLQALAKTGFANLIGSQA